MMHHDFFQENMAVLKKHHPRTWQVALDSGEPLGELCSAEGGELNLRVRLQEGEEIFLHQRQAPLAELDEYHKLVPENSRGVVAFIGMGLGYSPPAILQSRPHLRHLVVFEPETGIFIQALHALDLKSLLADPRVSIALGQEIDITFTLAPLSLALSLENITILKHLPCFRISPAKYQAVHRQVYQYASDLNITGNTASLFGQKFIENRLRNLTAIHHQRLLEHLHGVFAGMPAIIVAGGPSLDKNIHLLPKAKGKAVIIAADTVLPALLSHGVVPDFVSSIDPVDHTLEKIVNVAAAPGVKDIGLICSPCVAAEVSKVFPNRQIYWAFSEKTIEKWLSRLLGGRMPVTIGGTVAHLNFDAAVLLGCSPIVFVGQDLAFTGQWSHASHVSLNRSRETVEQLVSGGDAVWVEGYGGGKVPTDRAFLAYKRDFEQGIAAAGDRHFINATEGGARLEGTEELPLMEVLTRHCTRPTDVAALIREAEGLPRLPGRRRFLDELARTLKHLAGVEKDAIRQERLIAKLTDAVAKLREQGGAPREFRELSPALQRQFQEFDNLNKLLDNSDLWNLLAEVTIEGFRQSERLQQEIRQLADRPESFVEWMGKVIERSDLINRCRREVLAGFKEQSQRLQSRLRRELQLLRRLAGARGNHGQTAMELLRLYYEDGDFNLLEKLIADLEMIAADSPELTFYFGAIAGNRSQFAAMEDHFVRAAALDPSWSGPIADCRARLAGHYLAIARRYPARSLGHRMLFKAVRFAPENQEVRHLLAAEAADVSAKAKAAGQDFPVGLVDTLAYWHTELLSNAGLVEILDPEQTGALHRYYGLTLSAAGQYPEAFQVFAAAVELIPGNPELHLLLADAAFACNEYPDGVASLDRAVALDRSCALYWEKLGDRLLAEDHPSEAVVAYEKGFSALPEEIGLLKKIGDCYQAMNQLEAAREAYRLCLEMAGRVERQESGFRIQEPE